MARTDAPALEMDPPDDAPAVSAPTIIIRPDGPDLPGGEWSRPHAKAFMESRPKVAVYIPLEPWQKRDRQHHFMAGWNGHWYPVLMGKSVLIPDVIAEIIENSLADVRTIQAQENRQYISDIGDTSGAEIPMDGTRRG